MLHDGISTTEAGLIPRSVRLEVTQLGALPDAPSKKLVEACVLLADISGFTALGEKLTAEHGDSLGAEKFAAQMSAAISALVNVTHRYEGECVKIAGDCLICTFSAIPSDPEDEGDQASFERAKECAIEMLKVIKETNPDLDLHGGLASSATLQRIHLKELRGSSPRSNSARQRMKKINESTMSKAEFERSRQRWFLIAGRPIKIASNLLDKAKAGTILVYGGIALTRETNYSDITFDDDDDKMQRRITKRGSMIDTYTAELSTCPEIAASYVPPIVRAKGRSFQFANERRRVVIVFLSLPGLAKVSVTSEGVNEAQLNDVYSALRSVLAKFEGEMRDFLFEDKGCTLIACFGINRITEVDALRGVLFALEASSACSSLSDPCKIGISMGQCFTGICGHPSRNDFVVMGAETNMAARLMGKAALGKILVSERVYNATQSYVGYDMSNPMEVKGKDGTFRALCPFGRKAGAVRHKNQDELDKAVFVGRVKEMTILRKGLKVLLEEKKGGAYILEGLAGMGKSAIVWQLQREAIDDNVRFLMGTGSAIEKQTPFFAFGQILTAAANLSSKPSYGEVLALKHTYQLEEEDVNALGIILPSLAKRDEAGNQIEQGRLEGRAAQVCLKIFNTMERSIFIFEDAHWIDSQSWVMLQMVLPQLATGSIVMIVTRPPDMASQMKGGGHIGTEGFVASEETTENEWLEDNDRVKFSRILAGLKSQSNIEYISLGVMGIEAMRELIAQTLEVSIESVSDDFVNLMNQKAGGIPMYLTSMTSWLKEKQMVSTLDDGTIKFEGELKDIEFPSSIMDTVLERIDSLDEAAKTLVKVCSCFGFEFGAAYLEKVAPTFLNIESADDPLYQNALLTLAARGLVAPVTGESVLKLLKFSHQIITESAYNLMLDSQRRDVHKLIATEYEKSTGKFEMEVLAHHWLRSGDTERGCTMLEAAATKAIDIGAYKEAVNQLSLALNHGRDHPHRCLWMVMIAMSKWSFGGMFAGQDDAVELAFDALEELGDPGFMPQVRSATTVDMMIRNYATLNDVPPSLNVNVKPIERAKMLICLLLSIGSVSLSGPFRKISTSKYGLKPSNIKLLGQWYHQKTLQMAYDQGDINAWTIIHNFMHKVGWYEADQVRQCYRRAQTLITSNSVRPEYRVECVANLYTWYIPHAPEFISSGLQQMVDILPLISGNIKHTSKELWCRNEIVFVLMGLGDHKTAKVYLESFLKIQDDTEAIEDSKASNYQHKLIITAIHYCATLNVEALRETRKNFFAIGKKFPNTKKSFPIKRWIPVVYITTSAADYFDGNMDLVAKNYESAIPLIHRLFAPYRTYNIQVIVYIFLALEVYAYLKKKGEEDLGIWIDGLKKCRETVDNHAKTLPGMYRCSGQAISAQISLLLEDRPYAAELKRMEDALAYTLEINCMIVCVNVLKDFIGVWKCDDKLLAEAKKGYEDIGFGLNLEILKRKMEKIKSGEITPVDLTFVPENMPDEEGQDDPLMAIEKAILEAKAKVNASKDDKVAWKAARAEVKRLNKEKKEYIKKMEAEANAVDIDAKISELQANIEDANNRAMAAMEEDDEDAEEAAYEEAEKLMDELEKLKQMMSGPKKKLVDAKETDKALN